MTLRDFLKANKSLTDFKKLYHERSKTKITYRQIEANLLTAGEDFIINALHFSHDDNGYWVALNTKWNDQLKATVIYTYNGDGWGGSDGELNFKFLNNLEEKFKKAYLKRNPKCYSGLSRVLSGTSSVAISSSFTWTCTSEGYDFWYNQHIKWQDFCKNK